MNTKQLKYMLTLAQEQNFSSAAARLGISQPALSKYIVRLESELGTELFDRSQVPVRLTSEGALFAKTASNILREENSFFDRIRDNAPEINETVSIGISPFRSIHMMPDVVKEVNEKYPGIHIVLCERVASDLEKAVLNGSCDFAISVLPVSEPQLSSTVIGEERIVLAVPKKIANAVGLEIECDSADMKLRQIPTDKFIDIPFIVLGKNQRLRNMYDAICTLLKTDGNRQIEVVNLETAYALVNADIGAALLPDVYINGALKEKVYCFSIEHTDEFRRLAVIVRKDAYLTRGAKKIIKLLIERSNISQGDYPQTERCETN